MSRVGIVLWVMISTLAVAGKSRKDIPPAPLPSIAVNAKKVVLPNGGGERSRLRRVLFGDEEVG